MLGMSLKVSSLKIQEGRLLEDVEHKDDVGVRNRWLVAGSEGEHAEARVQFHEAWVHLAIWLDKGQARGLLLRLVLDGEGGHKQRADVLDHLDHLVAIVPRHRILWVELGPLIGAAH